LQFSSWEGNDPDIVAPPVYYIDGEYRSSFRLQPNGVAWADQFGICPRKAYIISCELRFYRNYTPPSSFSDLAWTMPYSQIINTTPGSPSDIEYYFKQARTETPNKTALLPPGSHWYEENPETFYVQYFEYGDPSKTLDVTGKNRTRTIDGTVYYGRYAHTIPYILPYCELNDILQVSEFATYTPNKQFNVIKRENIQTTSFVGLSLTPLDTFGYQYDRLIFTNSLNRGSGFYGTVKKMAYSPWTIGHIYIDTTDQTNFIGYCQNAGEGINDESEKHILYDRSGIGGSVPGWTDITATFYSEAVTYNPGHASEGGQVLISKQASSWKKWNGSAFVACVAGDTVNGTYYADQWLARKRISKNEDTTVLTLL
jgi:hypothetical protein